MRPEDFKVSDIRVKLVADSDMKVYCYEAQVSYGSRKWNADGIIIHKPNHELSISYGGVLYIGGDDLHGSVESYIKEVLPDLIVYG